MSVKVQIRFEDQLLEQIDRRAGERGRSQWIMEACRARLGETPAAPRALREGAVTRTARDALAKTPGRAAAPAAKRPSSRDVTPNFKP